MGHNYLLRIARPVVVKSPLERKGTSNRVEGFNKFTVTKSLEDIFTHPRHDPHGGHDVRRVSQLDSNFRQGRPNRSHGEGDHIHGPSSHAAGEAVVDSNFEFVNCHPVAQSTLYSRLGIGDSVPLVLGDDEGFALHPGNIGGIGLCQVTVLVLWQVLDHTAPLHHIEQISNLPLRAINHVHVGGFAQRHSVPDESADLRTEAVEAAGRGALSPAVLALLAAKISLSVDPITLVGISVVWLTMLKDFENWFSMLKQESNIRSVAHWTVAKIIGPITLVGIS